MVENKANVRILVVDDEQGMRDMLSYELIAQGFQVNTAADGAEAVEMVRKNKYDLVLSDIKMPRMDGLTALEEIKKIDPNIEVIMATGFGTIDMAVSAMKKGAYDFIQKPYNLDEVGLLIEKALEKSELRALIALYETSQALFSTVKISELLPIVMELIQKVLQADEGSLMLLREDGNLGIAASIGLKKEITEEVYLKIGERISGWAAAERRELLLVNGLKDHPEFKGMDINERISSSIVIPLTYQNELLGVLNLNRLVGHDHFTASDLRNASIFASQVAQAVKNAKLYQTLEKKIEELRAAYQMLEETTPQLVESEKLASIGKLVAGIAHELNNPLTSVLGYTELLLQTSENSQEKEQLEVVYKEAERCRNIIQDLLVFARRREPVLERVDVPALLLETLEAFSIEIKKNNVLVVQRISSCPPTAGDTCQLRQVFMNILVNAMHAVSGLAGERKVEVEVAADDKMIRITFKDNGYGIDEKNLSKIFDPFFSTKEVGKGTGLGLSLSLGIVKQHGGNILARSQKGLGATFVIELPIKATDALQAAKADEQIADAAVDLAGKRILVVEDEPAIRNFLSRSLAACNCKVDIAENGKVALDLIGKNDYDVIVSDFLMPVMDGATLFKKIQETKPKLCKRIIFMTGDADKKLQVFFSQNNLLFLMKPFGKQALIPLLQKVLRQT